MKTEDRNELSIYFESDAEDELTIVKNILSSIKTLKPKFISAGQGPGEKISKTDDVISYVKRYPWSEMPLTTPGITTASTFRHVDGKLELMETSRHRRKGGRRMMWNFNLECALKGMPVKILVESPYESQPKWYISLIFQGSVWPEAAKEQKQIANKIISKLKKRFRYSGIDIESKNYEKIKQKINENGFVIK